MKLSYFFLLITIFTISLSANKIKITSENWYPYVSEELHNKGISTHIVEEVFKNLQLETKIEFIPFEKGYEDTKNGLFSATYPYFKTDQREKEMIFSNEILKTQNVVFFNRNFINKKEIYKNKIGLVKGYAYKNIDVEKFKDRVYFNNELSAFNKLNVGEITLLPSNKLVGIHFIKEYFNDFHSNIDFLKEKKYISEDSLYLITSNNPKNKEFINKFNEGLKYLKESGKYDEILLKNKKLFNPDISDYVKLVGNSSFPIVVASEEINSQKKYMLPSGTKAIVLEWSEYFKKAGVIKFYDEMLKKTKVKIVNGPLKGKILYIENMYIQID